MKNKRKTKNENYIQLQQIHISKMKDLPDRRKKCRTFTRKKKRKQNIKLIAICFDVVFSDFLTIKELMAKQLPKKQKKRK